GGDRTHERVRVARVGEHLLVPGVPESLRTHALAALTRGNPSAAAEAPPGLDRQSALTNSTSSRKSRSGLATATARSRMASERPVAPFAPDRWRDTASPSRTSDSAAAWWYSAYRALTLCSKSGIWASGVP